METMDYKEKTQSIVKQMLIEKALADKEHQVKKVGLF
jgi:hypothetical protein